MNLLVPLLVAAFLYTPILVLSVRDLPPRSRRFILRVMLAGFVLRVTLATLFEAIPSLRVFHEDANAYEYYSLRIARAWAGDTHLLDEAGPPPEHNAGVIYVFSTLVYVFGQFPLNISLFNSMVGALSIGVVFRIGRRLFHEAVARRAALFTAFLPSMIVWSAIALKDAMVSFIILVTTLYCIRLRHRFSLGNLVGVIVPIAVVYPLRFYLVYFLVLSVVGTMALNRRGGFLAGFSKQIVLVGVLAAIVGGIGLGDSARTDFEVFDLSRVSNYRHGMAVSAHSGFDEEADVSTPGKALAFLPVGVAALLWSPFPWQMTSLRPILTLPEMLIWWWFAPSLIRGIAFAIRRYFREVSPILVFAATLLVGYSLAMGNVGAAFRMRAQILNLLFLFAALGSYLGVIKRKRLPAAMLLADVGAVA